MPELGIRQVPFNSDGYYGYHRESGAIFMAIDTTKSDVCPGRGGARSAVPAVQHPFRRPPLVCACQSRHNRDTEEIDMNKLKTAAATLLIATLAMSQASFADGRGRGGDNDYRQDRHARYDDRRDRGHWDGRDGYRHHYRGHHRHHGHGHGYGHFYGHHDRRWAYDAPVIAPRVVAPQIVLPLPLPPVPVIVLKKHHDAHVVLRPF
jgi:hypothetical protein